MRTAIAVVLATMILGLVCGPLLAQTSVQEPLQMGWLSSVRMFDMLSGWAESAQGFGGVGAKGAVGSVVRTTDGGIHWKDVTPLRPVWRVGWLTSRSAWVLAPRDPPSAATTDGAVTALFHTVDGGQTWKSVTVPFLGMMDFINTRDGWLRVGQGDVDGDVYRSTDGGQTWIKFGSAPFPGRAHSMTFLNATTGWITGDSDARDGIYLLATRDGGRTWQEQKLSLPEQVTPPFSYHVVPPRFFTRRDGVLSQPDASYFVSYVTHDGGASWTPTTPVTLRDYYRGSSFADVNHGWVTDGDTLYVTTNGGRQWTTLRPGPPFAHVQELHFISPQVGWASGQPVWPQLLLKTIDGGRTWGSVAYTTSR